MADDNAVAVAAPEAPKKKDKKSRKRAKKKAAAVHGRARGAAGRVAYPKDSLLSCIRISQAIIDQNAGEACTDREGAAFAHVGWTGELAVEISSAIKYGLLERPQPARSSPPIWRERSFAHKIQRTS